MEVSGQLHATAAFPSGKSPRYPLDRRVGGLQSLSGRCGEEKDVALAENRTPAVQPVACRYTDSVIPTPLTVVTKRMRSMKI
jgi:hypothetical protein